MNKTERLAVVVLFGVLIAWSLLSPRLFPRSAEPEVPMGPEMGVVATNGVETAPLADGAPQLVSTEPTGAPVVRDIAEKTVTLTNGVTQITFTSWGGGIKAIALPEYNATVEKNGEPVVFTFSDQSPVSYSGIEGISESATFDLESIENGRGVRLRATGPNGLVLTRTAILDEGYQLVIEDQIENAGSEAFVAANPRVSLGEMSLQETGKAIRGIAYLGADYLTRDGKFVRLGKQFRRFFGAGGGCAGVDTRGMPLVVEERTEGPMEWGAVKNKFFVQILEPTLPVSAFDVRVGREDNEDFHMNEVAGSLVMDPLVINPGESAEVRLNYYLGPKKYSILRDLGNKRSEVMGFGFFKPVCVLLLPLLNGIEYVIPGGYGIAIIILTIIVKMLFWPVTHKGTESMKRMQQLQPELQKLKEKYKKDPKKLQEKQMLLYREHKINPLAGCLPIVVQIPVFISLFTVLRSAVELRFSRFLWIKDLSEPEGLLAGVIPFPESGLNILPLLMTATMVLQQRMTPTAGDPQQQKVMAFLPVMMLFIFYGMPSALVLYWTVSQLLSILQLYLQRKRDPAKK